MTVLQDKNMVPKQIFLWDYVGRPAQNTPVASQQQIVNMALLSIDDHAVPYSPFPDKSGTQNNNLGFGVTLLWNKTVPFPITTGNMTFYLGSTAAVNYGSGVSSIGKMTLIDYDSGVFVLWCKETRQYWGYDLNTGNMLWGPTDSTPQLDYYAVGGHAADTPGSFGYGMLFNAGYGGVVTAYNITTGKLLWNYTATNIGSESPYGNYPTVVGAIADGKVYIVSGEHSATQPMWRGAQIRCLNATTGAEMWKLTHFVMDNNDHFLSVASGYIVAPNDYDGQLYCIGKGPSATTVSTPLNGVSMGSSFTITGTVTDQSPGTKNPSQQAIFPNGVPAVSDASQQGFMEYLYEQQAKPTNITGVPVRIDVIDPNGNYVNLGDATSSGSGYYNFEVKPDMLSAGPGTYTVIATFTGSDSYGSSSAESAFTINPAPTTEPTAIPLSNIATTSDLMTMMAIGVVAIIIAIAIVGFLMLRKHP